MKKIMALGMALVLLTVCACQKTQDPLPSSGEAQPAMQTESGVSASSQPSVPTAQEDILLRDYIGVYEAYCAGAEFSAEHTVSMETAKQFLFGWLIKQDETARYAVYNGSEIDYYTVPESDAEQFCTLYFGAGTSAGISEDGRYEASKEDAPQASEVKLRLRDNQTLENGNIELTVRRFQNGREWYPARYVFAPVTVESVPPMLEGKTARGGVLYQFVSVENLPLKSDAEGTEVLIRTAKELTAFAELVNSGDWEYQNNIYRLDADIDLAGVPFTPIGSYRPADARDPAPMGFSAVLDGNGHTIRNLTVRQTQEQPVGLFSVIGEAGFVSDFTLENCEITADESAGLVPVGGIAGESAGGIARCTVSGRVRGVAETGGIVGRTSGVALVQDCRSSAALSGRQRVGGIAGYAAAGRFLNCTATGAVNGFALSGQPPQEIGGFIGRNDGASIERGIVSAQVQTDTPGKMVGGFAGFCHGELTSCFYSSDIPGGAASPIGQESAVAYAESELFGMTQAELTEMGAFS